MLKEMVSSCHSENHRHTSPARWHSPIWRWLVAEFSTKPPNLASAVLLPLRLGTDPLPRAPAVWCQSRLPSTLRCLAFTPALSVTAVQRVSVLFSGRCLGVSLLGGGIALARCAFRSAARRPPCCTIGVLHVAAHPPAMAACVHFGLGLWRRRDAI